jgi:hypothetical protein
MRKSGCYLRLDLTARPIAIVPEATRQIPET